MTGRTPLIAGNWKMFGLKADLAELDALAAALAAHPPGAVEIVACPPATLISEAARRARGFAVGAQDCHAETEGAHTGDLSARMLAEAGASYVIAGHSERRRDHGETDFMIAAKARAAAAAGLVPIICVGETLAEREAGRASEVVADQLAGAVPAEGGADLVIAYEPVWAIGTGLTPSAQEIADMHGDMRRRLAARLGPRGAGARLLYGGSVKPANAEEILAVADVDGALVGGASLKAHDFLAIIAAHPAAGA